jgi:protein involved in polysaccharide export with SLBB domain
MTVAARRRTDAAWGPDRVRRAGFAATLAILVALIIAGPGPSVAQAPAQIDPRTLQQLQNQLGAGRTSGDPGAQIDRSREAAAEDQLRDPRAPTAEELAVRRARSRGELATIEPATPVEREFRERLGDPTLRQFGYDLFQNASTGGGAVTGALGSSYVLGVGDELIVSLRGATNDSRTLRVDREGRIVMAPLPPVRAAGRTLAAVRAELQATTRRTLLGTDVDVSVGGLRAISVFVGGEVLSPGQYRLTAQADVVAALALAGGVRRSGSLRRVRVVRAGGGVREVDLYGLLGIGAQPVVRLAEGDRVIVPVIGPTAAIAGGVARPGVYELRGPTSAQQLLDFAGGAVRPRGGRLAISRIGADGAERFVGLASLAQPIQPGDAVQVVAGSAGGAQGRVLLRGFVLDPGPRPLALTPTLHDLIGGPDALRAGAYRPLAIIIRRDASTGARRFVRADLRRALTGGDPVPLESEDRVFILSQSDADFINAASVREVVLGRPNPLPGCRPLARLEDLVRDTQSARYTVVTRGSFLTAQGRIAAVGAALAQRQTAAADTERLTTARDALGGGEGLAEGARDLDIEEREASCPPVFQEEPELLPVLIESAISVGGAVRKPGAYPVAGPVDARTLEALAEGLLGETADLVLDVQRVSRGVAEQRQVRAADPQAMAALTLSPGDDLRFNAAQAQFEAGAVLVTGEVGRPGLYTIRKGETLAQLLARAGGVTEHAYPYGAVFTRRAVREAQQEGLRRTQRELNEALLTLSARRSEGGSAESVAAAAELIRNLGAVEAPGRVVVEADPRVLARRPDLDTVLEAGDALFVPKAPNYVLALGDLSNPGALQFVAGKTVGAYLSEAGGERASADDDRVFVVLPNGSAQPMKQRFLRGQVAIAPPPGSTIIVPKNIDPLYGLNVARDITTIIGQFVSSLATVAILATQ